MAVPSPIANAAKLLKNTAKFFQKSFEGIVKKAKELSGTLVRKVKTEIALTKVRLFKPMFGESVRRIKPAKYIEPFEKEVARKMARLIHKANEQYLKLLRKKKTAPEYVEVPESRLRVYGVRRMDKDLYLIKSPEGELFLATPSGAPEKVLVNIKGKTYLLPTGKIREKSILEDIKVRRKVGEKSEVVKRGKLKERIVIPEKGIEVKVERKAKEKKEAVKEVKLEEVELKEGYNITVLSGAENVYDAVLYILDKYRAEFEKEYGTATVEKWIAAVVEKRLPNSLKRALINKGMLAQTTAELPALSSYYMIYNCSDKMSVRVYYRDRPWSILTKVYLLITDEGALYFGMEEEDIMLYIKQRMQEEMQAGTGEKMYVTSDLAEYKAMQSTIESLPPAVVGDSSCDAVPYRLVFVDTEGMG